MADIDVDLHPKLTPRGSVLNANQQLPCFPGFLRYKKLAKMRSSTKVDTKCIYERCHMTTTRVFQSGNSQAVRIPKEFQFDTTEVDIFRRGEEIILRPHRPDLTEALALLAALPEDFMAEGRRDVPPQERDFE